MNHLKYQNAEFFKTTLNRIFLRPINITTTIIEQNCKKFSINENMSGPIEEAIKQTLSDNLQPVHIEVINESYMHNVPKGSESHFKVLVVSEKFQDLTLIKRHRLINDLVKQKLDGNFVHALSIEAKTPLQWDENYKVDPSPNCRGGFGK